MEDGCCAGALRSGSSACRTRVPPPSGSFSPGRRWMKPGTGSASTWLLSPGGSSTPGCSIPGLPALVLGSAGGPVQPVGRLSYVPAAALVFRREALAAMGGFDERLPFGEDVDIAWRLAEAGWVVRYDPSAQVGHQGRSRWPAM